MLSTWLSHEDGVHLFEQCISAPDHHFYVVYGVSKNTRSRVDNSHGPLAGRTQGGGACDVGYSGNIEKTLSAR